MDRSLLEEEAEIPPRGHSNLAPRLMAKPEPDTRAPSPGSTLLMSPPT